MSLTKFESMLKTNSVYFFDLVEFEEIIIHYLDIGKISLAKKAVILGLEQHPQSVDLKLLMVEVHLTENDIEKASKLLRRIEILAPNNDEVFIQKATIASKKGFHSKAIENLEKALSLTEDQLDVWNLLGMEFLYIDDFKNARINFSKCLKEEVEDYAALYNIMYCFDMEKLHEEAIVFLDEYINQNPYCEVAWHQLGRQYFILELYEEALKAFDYSVLIDEFFIGGYLEKAKTLEELGNYQDAIDNYLITLELDDPTAFVYTRIGECFERLEKFATAISYYKKAVHEDPLLDKGWMLLTNLYYQDKDYQKALHFITKALKIDEDNALYWKHYAEINLKLNFYEEAVIGFKTCIQLGEHTLETYIGLADVLSFLGDFDNALKTILDCKKLYKNFAEISYRLSGLYFILNDKEQALSNLIAGMKIDYDYHMILKELYPSVHEDKKVQKLIKDYKKATE